MTSRRRYATDRVRKLMRQEELKDQVFQYAGKHTKKTDRVYVWGYAATGALGKGCTGTSCSDYVNRACIAM